MLTGRKRVKQEAARNSIVMKHAAIRANFDEERFTTNHDQPIITRYKLRYSNLTTQTHLISIRLKIRKWEVKRGLKARPKVVMLKDPKSFSTGFNIKNNRKKIENPRRRLITAHSAAQLSANCFCTSLKVPSFTGNQNPPRR